MCGDKEGKEMKMLRDKRCVLEEESRKKMLVN